MKDAVRPLVLALLALGLAAAQTREAQPTATERIAASPGATREQPISPKQLVMNVLHDQQPVWTFPLRSVQGQHWRPVVSVVLGTAALVALDPHIEPHFHDNPGFSTYKTGPLRGRNTTLAITLTPVIFYVAGLVKRSSNAQNTGILAAEAIADTQVVSFVTKHAIGRLIPGDIPPTEIFVTHG